MDRPLTHGKDSETDLKEEVSSLVSYIAEKQIETPVLFFLELYRPFVFLADSILIVGDIFLRAFLIPQRFLAVFRDRKALDLLIKTIEQGLPVAKQRNIGF